MSDDIATVPIPDGTVRRLFDDPEFRVVKRGYEPAQVSEFLNDLGSRMVNLLGRLKSAEGEAKRAQAELDDYRLRAEHAESSRALFDRTLVLAEETANAAVADARERAVRIEADAQRDADRKVGETRLQIERMMDAARADAHKLFDDERRTIAETRAQVSAESDQLETLRLAVAAETMALEEIRNELRRRIRRAATEMLGVAESPDCLGTPVTRGIPEVVARRARARGDEQPAVAGPERATSTGDGKPLRAVSSPVSPPAPAPPAADSGDAEDTDTEIDEVEDSGPATPTPGRSIDLVEVDDADAAADAVTVVADEAPTEGPPTEDAFDRFMSDEIEDEPSRTWILA